MILLTLLLIPLMAAALIALTRRRAIMELLHAVTAIAVWGAGGAIAVHVWNGEVLVAAVLFRVDALSALMVIIITFLGAIASLYAVGYIRAELDETHLPRVRLFFSLFHLFLFTMLVAVTTDNLGVMWVAIEGTTLATVFLVNLRRTRTSLEAAYKYLILSSVGIALAFIGTALVYYAGAARAGEIAANWSALRAAAGSLDSDVMRLAFVFIIIGYGTKAGLAPMHTWLPDAHSEAPAPISALMSGVLLNVGLYAMLRFKAVVDVSLGPEFAARLLIGVGLLSLLVAAAFLVRQRNYKRMLAYSSVEHMGIICLGLGFGGYWGIFGGLLHAAPWTGALFLAGMLALIGLPPFAPFVSEFIIFRAGVESYPWTAAVGVLLLVIVFGGMLASVNRMLYGDSPAELGRGDTLRFWLAQLALNFALLIVLGLTLPSPFEAALKQVLQVLGV